MKFSEHAVDSQLWSVRVKLSNAEPRSQASLQTRSQAVARIADRTAWQHLWGLRDIIGHVTSW